MNKLVEEYIKRNSYIIVEGDVTKFRKYPKDLIGTLLIDTDNIQGLISIKTDKGYIVVGKTEQLKDIERETNGIIKTT